MKQTHGEKLLGLLHDREWHSNAELVQAGVGFRYGAVIHNLRKKGYIIETKAVSQTLWEYRLRRLTPVKP